jgi:D-psicose/D-tagatose/L-ribulose 3-epimerase
MKNKLGMNLLLWGTEIDDSMFPVLEKIKEIGFCGVEVPIFNTNPEHWYNFRKKLDELGLDRIAVTINGPDHNFINPDPSHRKNALERNKLALDCAMVLGSDLLTGPFHSALGVFTGQKATLQEKEWARENLWDLAEYADSLGITLGLEYLNRFESYLVSSIDELLDLVNYVDHPACKIMFDTFHANIEEKSIPEAIKKIGGKLIHVQLSENDRGTLGAGHVQFEEILKSLESINYKGMLSIEAFNEKLAAANIWRKMFESEEQLMKDSYGFLDNLTSKM